MEKGREEGRLAEKRDIARTLKAQGVGMGIITQSTGLTVEEIENL
jgi:predicted transposase/invertase (TIGR01784 family)